MNLQQLFDAVRNDPQSPTILVLAWEWERQGYQVTVNDKYVGAKAVSEAEENGDFLLLSANNGYKVILEKTGERQSFRVHHLDLDAFCITSVDSKPVAYVDKYTTGFYKRGDTN